METDQLSPERKREIITQAVQEATKLLFVAYVACDLHDGINAKMEAMPGYTFNLLFERLQLPDDGN